MVGSEIYQSAESARFQCCVNSVFMSLLLQNAAFIVIKLIILYTEFVFQSHRGNVALVCVNYKISEATETNRLQSILMRYN